MFTLNRFRCRAFLGSIFVTYRPYCQALVYCIFALCQNEHFPIISVKHPCIRLFFLDIIFVLYAEAYFNWQSFANSLGHVVKLFRVSPELDSVSKELLHVMGIFPFGQNVWWQFHLHLFNHLQSFSFVHLSAALWNFSIFYVAFLLLLYFVLH